VYDRKYKGVEARCVYLEDRTQLRPEEVRWCFAVTTGLPVVTLMAYETWYTEFTSYKPFGNRFVPGKIELFELGKSRAAAVIESIDPNVPNQDIIFKLPAEAIGRRWCEDMHPPRYLSGRRIAMPDRSLVAQQGLELTYEVTIGENGRVLEVVPMEEKAFIDMPVFAAVYTWRYEPARCGGTPVPTDIVLSPWFITHGHRNF
jgi:hypothetical protein